MRSSTADELVRLVPPRHLSLDQALEFLREDECVEVTPHNVRLRKVLLDAVGAPEGGAPARAGVTAPDPSSPRFRLPRVTRLRRLILPPPCC